MRPLIALLFFFIALTSGSAQMERTMYQVFAVDSFKFVSLEIADIYDIEVWGGSSILIETNIQISNASREIVDFLIKEGRYDVKADTISPQELQISTKQRNRKPIKTPSGECTEIPKAKIFVPDVFIWTDDKKLLTRKE
ncbi:MAG: hypothetical protein IT269_12975 [Saprospiraceae bacterium]|nr:hypothetical protein [Saprospiraceae bacterium]